MFCAAFATIIGANMALVYYAVGSFPGLETRAPYVESLSFETRRIAQEKLNWTSEIAYKDGQVILTLTEPDGGAVVTPNISLIVGRATSDNMDQPVELEFDGRNYVADIDIAAGNWQAKVKATALDGTEFSRTQSLYIRAAS
jgi:nitrogen fixation protein FixH